MTKLQQRLIALGYLSGSADGSFGTKTENAVKRFQAALGLTQNGVASASLQQSLFSANAPIAVATAAPRVTQAPSPTKAPSTGGTTTSGYVDLEYGDKSDAVKRLQQRLKELGYFDHTATGKYYSETEAAVKRFQAALGLTQTGVATASLQTKLFASNAPMAQETASPSVTQAPSTDGKYTTLTRGSTGEEVRALQKRLIALGYLTGKADGDYGKATENAIKLFQKSIGYNENGTATEAVQEYLFSPYAPTYTAPASTATGAPAQPTQAPAQTEYTELRHGDTGDAVKRLQKRLKELGYFNGEIGGNYLDKTEAAVKLFESAIGWNTDGVATVVLQTVPLFRAGPGLRRRRRLRHPRKGRYRRGGQEAAAAADRSGLPDRQGRRRLRREDQDCPGGLPGGDRPEPDRRGRPRYPGVPLRVHCPQRAHRAALAADAGALHQRLSDPQLRRER